MEKTTQIVIGSTPFSLTEKAYAKLAAYLEELKVHFANEPEKEEIIKDIESRIAEKLLSKKNKVITEADIEAVTAEIGTASEFDERDDRGQKTEETTEAKQQEKSHKRFYRDTDNAMIAGVCSGIAAYFDIDPIIPRIIFVISIFGGGAGVLIYILLWVITPEASTTSQRLEMRGTPVTLENITRTVKDRVEEVKTRGVITRIARGIRSVILGILRFIGKVVGVVLVAGSFIAIIGLTIGAGIFITNWSASYNYSTLREAIPDPLLFIAAIAAYFVVFPLLMLIFSFGLRLIRRESPIRAGTSLGLIGLWALAVIVLAVTGVRISGEYYEYVRTSPEFQVETRTLDLPPFSNVSASDVTITFKNGTTTAVMLDGQAGEMENISASVADGTLTVSRVRHDNVCFLFCMQAPPDVTIVSPDIGVLDMTGATGAFDDFVDDTISVRSSGSYLYGTLTAKTVSLTGDGERIRLRGTVDTMTAQLDRVYFDGGFLTIGDLDLAVSNTHGRFYVTGQMNVTRNFDSDIENVAEESRQTGTE